MKKIIASCLFVCASHAVAADVHDASSFAKVFDAISAKDVLNKNAKTLFKSLADVCAYKAAGSGNDTQGNVQCGKDTDVRELDVAGTEDPQIHLISAVIYGNEKCDYMKHVLSKNFGRPRKIKGDCHMEWAAKGGKGHGRTLVGMQLSKEENQIYFSINEEEESEP